MRRPDWYRPESDRYLTLDALRFLAAACVVTLHYGAQASWSPALAGLHGGLRHLQMAVDLFFVISGVMMADLYGERVGAVRSWLAFLRRRFARLAPLHYATFAIVALGAFAHAALHDPRPFDTCGFGSNLLMLQAFGVCDHLSFNKPSWSISAEMGLYVALPVVLWMARWRVLAFGLVGLMLVAALLLDPRGWPNWIYFTYDFGVVRAVPAFLLGVLLAQTPALSRIPAPRVMLGACAALLVLECVAPVPNAVRVATVYGLAVFGLAADRQHAAGALVSSIAPLSRLTYSIYMLHHLVGGALIAAVAGKLLGLTGASLNLAIILTAGVALPAASIASLLLFETPMRRWIAGPR